MRSTCLVLFGAMLVTGCDLFKVREYVISDTSWVGSFDGTTISGTGNRTIELDKSIKCAKVQKQTREGYLAVQFTPGDDGTGRATGDFAIVNVCHGQYPRI